MDGLLEEKYELSLSKILLLFFFTSTSTALYPLLSKQLKYTLDNNRYSQHVLGILTLLSLILMTSDGKMDTVRIILYTIIGYFWFVLTAKLDLQWSVIVWCSMMIFFIFQNQIKFYERQIEKDKNLSDHKKNILIKEKKKNYINITASIIIVTIIGTLLYNNKKEGQYGGGYSLFNYLLY